MRKVLPALLITASVLSGCSNVGDRTGHSMGFDMSPGGWTDETCNADHSIECDENGEGSHPCCQPSIGWTGTLSESQWSQILSNVEASVDSMVYLLNSQQQISYDFCLQLQDWGYVIDCSQAPLVPSGGLPQPLPPCAQPSHAGGEIKQVPGPAPPAAPMVTAPGVICRTALYGICAEITTNLGRFSTGRAAQCKGVCKRVLDFFNAAATRAAMAGRRFVAVVLQALALATVVACEPVCKAAIWAAVATFTFGCVSGANWVCGLIE